MYINIDKKPSKNVLGFIEETDSETITEIKALLNKKIIESAIDIILEKKNQKIMKKYKSIYTQMFMKNTFNNAYNKLNDLAKVIRDEPFKYGNEFTLDQIYDYYNEKVPGVVKKDLYLDFLNFTGINDKQPSSGKGEYLLTFFTSLDKSYPNGDLIDENGVIEIKGDNARFKGSNKNNSQKYGSEVCKELFDIGLKNFKNKSTINKSDLKQIFNFIKEKGRKIITIKKILTALSNYKGIVFSNSIINLINKMKNVNNFINLALTIHFYAYVLHEKISNLIFVGIKKEKFILFKVKKDFVHFYNFASKYLKNITGWSDSSPGYQFILKD